MEQNMQDVILVVNSGSSSIKFSVFFSENALDLLYGGKIDNVTEKPLLTIDDAEGKEIFREAIADKGHEAGLKALFKWMMQFSGRYRLKAAGHRIAHGGTFFDESVVVNDEIMKKMSALESLAPLHQPHNLAAIRIIQKIKPDLLQVVCFDTMFHCTQEPLAKRFAIPEVLTDQGIIRYGFHGLSYEYIASVLDQHLGEEGNGRVLVSHLGNGSSVCAIHRHKSVATSMGFTALDGLMMGTRCGRIDPGVLLHLIQQKKYSAEQVEHLLYKESGLLGVSGISHDVRVLLASNEGNAKLAIDLYCFRAAMEMGSLMVPLGGCDALVFSGGIGENAPVIRQKICDYLGWMGVSLSDTNNANNAPIISEKGSRLSVAVIPTNEELMIARHTLGIMEYGDRVCAES